MRIAVLGASGHVGKTLISEFASNGDLELHSYARNTSKILSDASLPEAVKKNVFNIEMFPAGQYDAIINCIGIGDTKEIAAQPLNLFMLTEKYDNLILSYLSVNPCCVMVNISSGAVYGSDFSYPADEGKTTIIPANKVDETSFYSVVKLYSEVKHRAAKKYKIIDLRLFSYFSAYINLDSNYFMADITNSILHHKEILTNRADFIRDYIHPSDFADLILAAIKNDANAAFDAYSMHPISKYEILKFVKDNYDVDVQYTDGFISVTGEKNQYYSENRAAGSIGYIPVFTSEETIRIEINKILEREKNG